MTADREAMDEAVDGIADALNPDFVSRVSREMESYCKAGDHTWVPGEGGRKICWWCKTTQK